MGHGQFIITITTFAFLSIYKSIFISIPEETHSERRTDDLPTRQNTITLGELTRNPTRIDCAHPLQPMYDRIIESSSNSTSARKIPRTIHASFNSRCLPPDLHDAMERWKQALPRHSFYFHDDEAVDRLFSLPWKEFPQLKTLMRCVRFKGAMKIDIWRILIIYKYGGIYTDIDQYPNPDREQFNEESPISADDEAFFLSDGWNRPSQWFFGMEPKHPIAYLTMHEIFERLQKLESIERPNVGFVTGPDALKFGYAHALGWVTDVGKRDDIYAEGTHKCLEEWGGKTVTKRAKHHGHVLKLDMKELVERSDGLFFAGEKITRKEKIESQSGVKHWIDQKDRKKIEFDGSCLQFMYALDALNNTVI